MFNFTDTHCHLDDVAFSATLPQLLAQCQHENIKRIIVPAISPKKFNDVLSLKDSSTEQLKIYSCLGIHPWYLDNLNNDDLTLLEKLVHKEQKNIIAIGETGLDGAISKNTVTPGDTPELNMAKQTFFFDFQLALAQKYQLPIIIHHRQSHQNIIPMLKRYKLDNAGVIHGFSGSYQQAAAYLDLGFKLGIGGTITYPRAKKTINAIKRLPLSSLLLETDAPSMPLNKDYDIFQQVVNSESSKYFEEVAIYRNSPLNVKQVFSALVEHRSETAVEIAEQLEKNVDDLFFS